MVFICNVLYILCKVLKAYQYKRKYIICIVIIKMELPYSSEYVHMRVTS